MVYDGIIGEHISKKKWIKINVKSGRGEWKKSLPYFSYQQHADEHERWLLARSKPDTRTALRHVPVIKRTISILLSTVILMHKLFIDTLLVHILFAASRFPYSPRRKIESARQQ